MKSINFKIQPDLIGFRSGLSFTYFFKSAYLRVVYDAMGDVLGLKMQTMLSNIPHLLQTGSPKELIPSNFTLPFKNLISQLG